MPIYEFYCSDCHMIFQFFSRGVNTKKRPKCPKCSRPKLSRKVSRFAITGKAKEEGDDPFADMQIDESKMMAAMASMEKEASGLNEDDPRAAAQFMRKFADMTGLPMEGAMGEALNRMEAGEDPDSIEAELGDQLDTENPFEKTRTVLKAMKKMREPGRDEELYDL